MIMMLYQVVSKIFEKVEICDLIADYYRMEWAKLVFDSSVYASLILADPDITVGRNTFCSVSINHPIVSNLHCKLTFCERKEGGMSAVLEDSSTNGTWVEKEFVHRQKVFLKHGDQILFARASTLNPDEVRCTFYLLSSLHQIGMYRVEKLLGIGSFAQVNLCTHIKTGARYAIKFYDKKIEKERRKSHSRHPLLKEIEILKQVSHSNIVQFIEAFETENASCIILEWLTGSNFFDYLVERKTGFKEKEARPIFAQLCSAVSYLHTKKIVHRDLKPDNIIFANQKEPQVKIIDFGLSSILRSDYLMQTVCGTLEYTAPEVLFNLKKTPPQPYDHRVDIWSLGVILYMMLCRQQPFHASKIDSIVQNITKGKFDICYEYTQLSCEAQDLLQRLLQVRVENRIALSKISSHPWMTGV